MHTAKRQRRSRNDNGFEGGYERDGGTPSGRSRRAARARKVGSALGGFSEVALLGLLVVVSIANIVAFHSALGMAMETKFSPVYTLGGLLTHYLFNATFRVAMVILVLWLGFLSKKKKNWLDWVGIVLLGICCMAGTETLLQNGSWVIAILFWYIFNSFQFAGIFDGENGSITTLALGTYVVEFLIQCSSNPITQMSLDEFLKAVHMGTIEAADINWPMVFINIVCMMGVEWTWRLYLIQSGKVNQ